MEERDGEREEGEENEHDWETGRGREGREWEGGFSLFFLRQREEAG